MPYRSTVLPLLFWIVFTASAAAQSALPTARPEDVGLDSKRLERIHMAVQQYIDSRQLSGAVTVVARRGKVVHFESHGLADVESKTPMAKDALFRMASSTKPVTAVAILMLMEEGKLRLADPVSRFIPEFKSQKVARLKPGSTETELVAANREITILDLLTHTSGLGSGGLANKELTVLSAERKPTDALADFIPKYGSLPLDFQPGTEWRYSGGPAFDTLGRIVEIASGMTFDRFLTTRLFEPLGMKETYFVVPAEKRSRLAIPYRSTPTGIEKMEVPSFFQTQTWFSGAGGLNSTAEDMTRFALMLVQGGQLDGRRILSPRTVALMGSNHVGSMFSNQLGRPERGVGFGLGVEVVTDPVAAGWHRSTGSFGWDGFFGTIMWVDPQEQMVGVLLIQRPGRDIYRDVESAMRQAIVE